MELRGFEPLTFCMPCRRATSCAIAPHGRRRKGLVRGDQTSPATISRHIGDIRRLLAQTGNTITPAARKLTTLDDLYQYAAGHGITIPAKPNQRVNN